MATVSSELNEIISEKSSQEYSRDRVVPTSSKYRVVVPQLKPESLLDIGNEIFDPTYSPFLNGYITEEQWSESITRINTVCESSTPALKLAILVGALVVVLGGVVVASAMMKLDSYNDMWVGGNTVNNTFRYIAIIGAVIILIGIITATLLYMIRSRKLIQTFKDCVDDENIYYKDAGVQFRLHRQPVVDPAIFEKDPNYRVTGKEKKIEIELGSKREGRRSELSSASFSLSAPLADNSDL